MYPVFLCFLLQSMEKFQQQLAEAEKAVYGQRRGEGDRDGWRRGQNESRERWRRRDGDRAERDRRRGNERERDSSPTDRERQRAGRREDRGEYRGREEDRCPDGERFRERNRGREREGDRFEERDRDRERNRNRERERLSATSSVGQNYPSLGSLKSRFLKPSEDDTVEGETVST